MDPTRAVSQKLHESATSRPTVVKFLTAGTIGAFLLLLAGLTLTGTTITLALATPLLVIASPVIVPAVFVTFLIVSGFFLSSAFGVSAVAALTWLYRYVSGQGPVGAQQLDHAKGVVVETAKDMKDKAKEYGQYVQQKAHEATQTKS